MIDSFDEIIPTAIQGASLKTFTDIPYSKEVLREAKKYDTLPTDIIVDKKSIIREARHKIIDELLLKNDASQILEIAAGYSPRGLIFTQDPKRQFVELDLPVVAQNKQKIVAGIESGRQNLHIIGGNALDESAFSATAQYFNGKKPIAVLNEGLLRYLTFDEKAILAKNILNLLKKFGGVWITGDGGFMGFRKNQNKIMPTHDKNLSKMVSRNTLDHVFSDKQEFAEFFDKIGFTTEFHKYDEVLSDLSSPNALSASENEARDILSGAYAIVLKVKEQNDR